ncbi:MAG: hypothetical protein M1816_002790 [Peltula sp. TS41687]|nr:MAG: hypothetical protein M1816_002790 [Peltula sp. TS41687]
MEVGTSLAIVSLLGQVASGIKTLHDLCSKAGSVSEDLQSLVTELRIFECQLIRLQKVLVQNLSEEDALLVRIVIQRCEKEMRALLGLINRLAPRIIKMGWKQTISAVFKEGEIARLKERLYRAQQGLMLASQLENSNQQQLEVKFQSVKIDESLLEINRKIESINQRYDNSEKDLPMIVISQLESVLKQVVDKDILPSLQNALNQHEAMKRTECNVERSDRRMDLTTIMSEKVRDYVFSPEPSLEKTQDRRLENRPLSKPLFRKSTIERYDGSYSSWLANIQYRSRLVRIETLEDEIGSKDREESIWNVRHEIETSFMVFPNLWLLNKGVKGSYTRTGEGWLPGFNITPFNIRPHDALIFEFCSAGNLEAVKSLLSRGDASPFDTDPDGWTPLHCAAQSQNRELCKLLITARADANAVDLRNRSPLHVALSYRPVQLPFLGGSSQIQKEETPAVVRLLVAGGHANPAMETSSGENCYDLIARTKQSHSDLFIWLLRQTTFDFDPHRRDVDGCTPIMKLSIMSNATYNDMEDLIYLGADVNAKVQPPEDYVGLYEPGWTVLHVVLAHMKPGKNDLQERIRCLLEQGADVHALSDRGETPTDITFRCYTREKFDIWISVLEESGYDIKEFVTKEIRMHADVAWYVMNWCDYYLEALLDLDEDLEMDLKDCLSSHLFEARELDNVQQPKSDCNDVSTDSLENDTNDWSWLDDLNSDSPVLSVDEQRAELREWMRNTWHRLRPGQELWRSGGRSGGWTYWNSHHSREEWILYGLYPC